MPAFRSCRLFENFINWYSFAVLIGAVKIKKNVYTLCLPPARGNVMVRLRSQSESGLRNDVSTTQKLISEHLF